MTFIKQYILGVCAIVVLGSCIMAGALVAAILLPEALKNADKPLP